MYRNKWSNRHTFILAVAGIIGAASLGSQVTTVRAIDYRSCAELYAVQPADTLKDIARHSATTEDYVLSRNNLDSESDIYPGLVLCLEDADNGGIIPSTGGRSGVEVMRVSPGDMVTILGRDFQEGANVNVYMFPFGVRNPHVVSLGSLTIPSSGTFLRSFDIPASLQSSHNLTIRFRNADENVSASTTFVNADVDRITANECAKYYTVRSGDVLGIVAQETNVSVDQLVDINNIIDASVIYPGQMLCTELK